MRCLIDGQEIDPTLLAPPAMNYGQLGRWAGLPQVRYRYELAADAFAALLGPIFAELRQSELDDAAAGVGGDGAPTLDAYHAAGLPELGELLRGHQGLLDRLARYMDLDILNELARRNGPGPARYCAGSLDRCWAADGMVAIEGLAFLVAKPGAPGD